MSGIIGGAGSKSGVIGETEIDYEEGTWEAGGTGASLSMTNTIGYYTKIGKRVFIQFYSSAITISSTSGSLARITGLPFTTSADPYAAGNFYYSHGNAVDGDTPGGHIENNATTMIFIDLNTASSSAWIDGSGKYVMVSGNYYID